MAIKSESMRKKDLKVSKILSNQDEKNKQALNLLKLIDDLHRERNIPKPIIFNGIEESVRLAAQRSSAKEEEVFVHLDRVTGEIIAQRGFETIDPVSMGRIAAQAAKQLMITKIRDAESEEVYDEFINRKGRLVSGVVQRVHDGSLIVAINKDNNKTVGSGVEAILPRSEQIPGESFMVNDRVKSVILDVQRNGNRVKIVLSRHHPDFVKSLFEQEIPEIIERSIEVKKVAREPGYRSKVGVASIDSKVDCVGACVGIRGSRIKSIINELHDEKIDIVRWNDSPQILIENALQPAEISEIMLYRRLMRAIVLVSEDNLSLAIGRRGQNVRLASKLVSWDIEIMTHDELDESLHKAEYWFNQIPWFNPNITETFILDGFLSYSDFECLNPSDFLDIILAAGGDMTFEEAKEALDYIDQLAESGVEKGDIPSHSAPENPAPENDLSAEPSQNELLDDLNEEEGSNQEHAASSENILPVDHEAAQELSAETTASDISSPEHSEKISADLGVEKSEKSDSSSDHLIDHLADPNHSSSNSN